MLVKLKGGEYSEGSAQGVACCDEASVWWQSLEPSDDVWLDRLPGAMKTEMAAG